MSIRSVVTSIALLTAFALAGAEASAAPASGDTERRATCGIQPGDGYYSYVKTKNVSCRDALKINRKAGNKFCSMSGNCDEPPTGGLDKGRVNIEGWRCKVKSGYEFFQTKCKRGSAKFKYESAA